MRSSDAQALIDTLRRTARTFDRFSIERRWSRAALRAAIRGGGVTRVLPRLFAATEHAESCVTRAHGATSWVGSGSVAAGVTAASAWELCDPPRHITVTAPYGMSRGVPAWLTLTRCSEPPLSAYWHGCPVAAPAWAVATAYGHLPRDQADELVYRAVRRGLATPADIADAASTLGAVRELKALRATVAAAAAGSESYLETLGLRSVFAPTEFAGFIRQHRMWADGASYRLDMYDPVTRTAVELDGAVAHAAEAQRARDVRRDARLASIGIATLRFTYRDLVSDPDWCREMVVRTMARRGAARVGTIATYSAENVNEWA